jgi:DNA-binding CsgD family transcriptional regulator
MTAPVFAPPSESYSSASLESFLSCRTVRQLTDGKPPRIAARRSSSAIAGRNASSYNSYVSPEVEQLGHFWSSLLELLPQGVMIVSPNLKMMYWNSKARELCQTQMGIDLMTTRLPNSISEACHQLLRDSAPDSATVLIKDDQLGHASLRISARWVVPTVESQGATPCNPSVVSQLPHLMAGAASKERSCIAIFLENCDETLEQEMRIQQKKYDLTDREAEICLLLRKEHTYQEIAKLLQISLNTVKTHVKNIYAKRRSYQGQEKVLILGAE